MAHDGPPKITGQTDPSRGNERGSPDGEQSFTERATALIEARKAQAENAALFGDDEELADTLRVYLETKLKMEGRTGEGGHLSDNERDDSAEVLERKKAVIDSLTLTPEGVLSRQGTEVADEFRRRTRRIVAEVLADETDGLTAEEVTKYRRLGENFVGERRAEATSSEQTPEVRSKKAEEQQGRQDTSSETLSEEQIKTKEAITKTLEEEDKLVENARSEGVFHLRRIKPMIDTLRVMSGNNEGELLQLVESFALRVSLLTKGKYRDEGQFAFGHAAREIYKNNFTDGDKQALLDAIGIEVQRQEQEGNSFTLTTSPDVVFRNFMHAFITAKKR